MRFLSSSAFAKAPKFRLAASCSAAETMLSGSEFLCLVMAGLVPAIHVFDRHALRSAVVDARHKAGHDGSGYSHYAAASPVCGLGLRISTDPPAFFTASIADFDAPATENAILVLISPEPSRRTPCLARRSTPAFTRVATSMVAAASSLPASMASCTRPRLTWLSSFAHTLLKPRFGRRRCSGI